MHAGPCRRSVARLHCGRPLPVQRGQVNTLMSAGVDFAPTPLVMSMVLSKRLAFILCQTLTKSRPAPCIRTPNISATYKVLMSRQIRRRVRTPPAKAQHRYDNVSIQAQNARNGNYWLLKGAAPLIFRGFSQSCAIQVARHRRKRGFSPVA